MNAAKAIAYEFAQIQIDEEIARQEKRYREAKAIVATIPSGTRDDDLTGWQRVALDEYEHAMMRLRELRA
jgi:hypothetical protein